jgi:hypothetical protein
MIRHSTESANRDNDGDDRRQAVRLASHASPLFHQVDQHGQLITLLPQTHLVNVCGGGVAASCPIRVTAGVTIDASEPDPIAPQRTQHVARFRALACRRERDGGYRLRLQLIGGHVPARWADSWRQAA